MLLWRGLEIHQSWTLSKAFPKLHGQKRQLRFHIPLRKEKKEEEEGKN